MPRVEEAGYPSGKGIEKASSSLLAPLTERHEPQTYASSTRSFHGWQKSFSDRAKEGPHRSREGDWGVI